MKVVWSLFDGSGIMGLPWAEAGYQVYCFNADKGNHVRHTVLCSLVAVVLLICTGAC
ncbi:Dcm [Salmonella phage SP069]|uniref:Dcm n=2 Tax=Nonanavirus TaxID=1921122 RepID=S4TW34_9CAUD|nr:Dcm [Salmonella phage SP069]AGF89292.1 hypothetical protein SP062_00060 [Salmonella phage FSL SP-062]AGF89575.1 Dcm [Salmonella phage SP069]